MFRANLLCKVGGIGFCFCMGRQRELNCRNKKASRLPTKGSILPGEMATRSGVGILHGVAAWSGRLFGWGRFGVRGLAERHPYNSSWVAERIAMPDQAVGFF